MNATLTPANGWQPFANISLADPFFDSLKADYPGFEAWFGRKATENAFVQYGENGQLQAFLYLKEERDAVTDVAPQLPAAPRLKVGTLKDQAAFAPAYWGFFPITDSQFRFILQQAQVHEGFIVD